MVGFAVDGLISQLNTTEIIDALLSLERAPVSRHQRRIASNETKITALQTINANLLSLRSASSNLSRQATFMSNIAMSARPEIVTATAALGASPTIVSVEVQQLARAENIATESAAAFASADTALGLSGSFLVNDKQVNLVDTDSLRTVAEKINGASAGVVASVVQTSPGNFQMALSSTKTGSAGIELRDLSSTGVLSNGLRFQTVGSATVADADGSFAYSSRFSLQDETIANLFNLGANTPSGTVTIGNGSGASVSVAIDFATDSLQSIANAINTASGAAGSAISATVEEVDGQFRLAIDSGDGSAVSLTDDNNVLQGLGLMTLAKAEVTQAGQDARAIVNGLQVERSTNVISDALDGITLNLFMAEPGTVVDISVDRDHEPVLSAVDAFVSSFNSLRNTIATHTDYNAETRQGGVLLGDPAVSAVQQRLNSIMFASVPMLGSQQLSSLRDGLGVSTGSIDITDKSGKTATIYLESAKTVDDVIRAINRNTVVGVEARVSEDGKTIVLHDTSGGGGNLSVTDAAGSTMAAELGIAGSTGASQMQGAVLANPGFKNLTELGFSFSRDGALSLDKTKFEQYLNENSESVMAIFTSAQSGMATRVNETVDFLTNSREGTLSYRIKGIEEHNKSLNAQILRVEERISRKERIIRNQFTRLEKALADMQNQSAYLNSQLSQMANNWQWNRNRG